MLGCPVGIVGATEGCPVGAVGWLVGCEVGHPPPEALWPERHCLTKTLV